MNGEARRCRCAPVLLLAACLLSARAAEPPAAPAERDAMLAGYREQVTSLTSALEQRPRDISLFSHRGDAHLFLGNFAAAIADFERMIALDPAQDAPHWRLGIAYHFAGQFAKSSAQFQKYHAYDNRDRENSLWKFLADLKLVGLDRARAAMLPYTRFDREPFPTLYALFAGTKTVAEFFADLEARGLDGNPRVMFFANYYAGLHDALHGRPDSARARLHAAVASPWGRTAEDGPAYMWQAARLHFEQLAARPDALRPRTGP